MTPTTELIAPRTLAVPTQVRSFQILFNRGSGNKSADDSVREIEEILRAAGRQFQVHVVEDPRQIDSLAQRAADAAVREQGAVIAAGGDGTINAVARAALPTGRPFGIIPQGTFNYSSRAHGIPLDTGDATRALLTAKIKPVQVGTVNDHVFLVNASLGLYPDLLEDRERFKQRFGRKRLVAFGAGIATLLHHHRQLTLDIECDQERETVRTPTLFVGNNPLQLEQCGLPEAEDVEHHRRLAAVLVRPVSSATMLWLALQGALGKLGEDDRVRNFAFRRLVVRRARGMPSHAKVAVDGEICRLPLPLEFTTAPQPLRLLVPDASTDA